MDNVGEIISNLGSVKYLWRGLKSVRGCHGKCSGLSSIIWGCLVPVEGYHDKCGGLS